MKVGHGRAPLQVADGTPLGGYADRKATSSGVLDDLGVDCVSWSGEGGRLLLVVAEVLCVNDDLAEAVTARVRAAVTAVGASARAVWVCATHTHAAPEVGYLPGGGSTPPAVRDAIAAAAAAAAEQAVADERRCSGRLHAGHLRDVGAPRGAAGGEPIVGVDALVCSGPDGRTLGVLVPLPVHPTVLPASSTLVSGDLAGAVRRALARRLPGAWVAVAHGAAGDVSTRRTRQGQTPAELARLGELAAEQLAAMVVRGEAGDPLWDVDAGAIAAARTTVTVPARRRDAQELEALRARLAADRHEAAARGDEVAARVAETGLQGLAVAEANAARGVEHVQVLLSAARIGRLTLLGVGGEPFHALRDDVRARRGAATALLACANAHMGYVPDEAALATPGYEALASPLRPGAPTEIVAALIDLPPDPERIP